MAALLEVRVHGSRWLHAPVLGHLPDPEHRPAPLPAERAVSPP
jgi:hypothetical protein